MGAPYKKRPLRTDMGYVPRLMILNYRTMKNVTIKKWFAEEHEGETKTAVLFKFEDDVFEGFFHTEISGEIKFDKDGNPSLPEGSKDKTYSVYKGESDGRPWYCVFEDGMKEGSW